MPIRPSVTVSLVPEARGGPFVFWDDLPAACRKAKALGFEGVEIFPRDPRDLDVEALRVLLSDHGLALAAMGTGAGWVVRRLTLTQADAESRARALEFIGSVIDVAGSLGAPAIIGSMQGRTGSGVDRSGALGHLCDGLEALGERAAGFGVPLLFEPLNRYETDLVNTTTAGVLLLDSLDTTNVKLLADLFHMNIEEADVAGAILAGGARVGHVHFVDSNRRPAGCGHIDFGPVASALADIGYSGFASAEALPYPDPDAAASTTIETFRSVFRRDG